MDDRQGKQIKGYQLGEEIGVGGYGVVYRAYQPVVGREVAIKVIHPSYVSHPEFIRRFEAEAHLVARLEHPHIVPLYDYWRELDSACLVMRWLRGGSVLAALQIGPMAPGTVATIIEQMAAALTVAHRRGVIHRDIKPANILLDEDHNAYLADFGIAKDLGETNTAYQTQPRVIGSPEYLSPEQIENGPITPQTDIYSLGVTIYEMLTGEPPYPDLPLLALLYKHIHDPLPSLASRRPELAPAIDPIIQRATAKEPRQRYPNVLSLARDLRMAIALIQAGSEQTSAATSNGQGMRGKRLMRFDTVRLTPEELQIETLAPPPLENPYKGLRPFLEGDAAEFFGREDLTRRLLARLADPPPMGRFLAVVGPSGSGKSSVVRAGVIPALRRSTLPGSERWFMVEMFPGIHPIAELEAALLRVAVHRLPDLPTQLERDEHGLARVVRHILPGDAGSELVLVIDQFEELFTRVEDEAERRHFLASLYHAATDPDSRLRIIITLRADFYDRPLLYAPFCDLMRQRTEAVTPLSHTELHEAIVQPAERMGLHVDPALVEVIVNDVGSQPGTLPLLQYALTELFEQRAGRTLSLATYQAAGGVSGALARRAEAIYNELDAPQRAAAQQLFLRLVTLGEGAEDTRRRARRSELAAVAGDTHTLESVIDRFCTFRLLTLDADRMTREPTIEIAHEALIRSWERLRLWLDASRDDLRMQRGLGSAATEWIRAGRDPSFLASGTRLDTFATWANQTHLALNDDERTFLQSSLDEQAAHEAREDERARRQAALERRSRRVLQALVGVLLLATLGALSLSGIALNQRQAARNSAQAATLAQAQAMQEADTRATAEAAARDAEARTKQQLEIADAQRIALAAQSQVDDQLETALLLAYEALSRDRNPITQQAMRSVLDRAFWQPLTIEGHAGPVGSAEWSPDGSMVATGSRDKTARLWTRDGQELARMEGHSGDVSVRWSPGGERLLTYSEDKVIRLWDTNGRQLVEFPAQAAPITDAEFSRNGHLVVASLANGTAQLWDLSGRPLVPLRGHEKEIRQVEFSPDGTSVVTASSDGTARIWNLKGETIAVLEGHKSGVNRVRFSPDGQRIVSAGDDSTARVWTLDGELTANLLGHVDRVRDAVFSPDGTLIVTRGADATARLWHPGGLPVATMRGHSDEISRVMFSPDGQLIVTASRDHSARVWDLAGQQIALLSHADRVAGAAFSPDGKQILTSAEDKTARIWTLAPEPLPSMVGHTDGINRAEYSPDGKLVVTASQDGTARLWNADGGLRMVLEGHTGWINDARFSPDGLTIATAADDQTVRLWNLEGEQLAVMEGHDGRVLQTAFSPNGDRLVSWGEDPSPRLWDRNGQLLVVLKGHTGEVTNAAFAPDGQHIVTASSDKTARVWNLDGTTALVLPEHGDEVNRVSYSPDGKMILTVADDNIGRLWSTTGTLLTTLEGHGDHINQAKFSPDGRHVLTASVDQTARLWNLAGQQLAIMSHTGRIRRIDFSPDGQLLVTGGTDRRGRLWDLKGQLLGELTGHTDELNTAMFSPNGLRILTASSDGTARQHLVDPDELLKVAACRVGRTLTADEIARFQIGTPRFTREQLTCPGPAEFATRGQEGPTTAPTTP